MKYLFLVAFFIGLASNNSFSQERYFHELRGFEDSTGTTQLFYRFYERTFIQENFETVVNTMYNHVYHFSTDIETDSVLLRSFFSEWTIPGMYSQEYTTDYSFLENDPAKWIRFTTGDGTAFAFQNFEGAGFGFPSPIIIKSENTHDDYSLGTEFILSTKNDSLYYLLDDVTIAFSSDAANWLDFGDNYEEDYEAMINYFDSTHFDYRLLGIHPVNDSLYFGIDKNGHLFKSENYSSSFTLADSSSYFSHRNSKVYFDANADYVYSSNYRTLSVSSQKGDENSWAKINLPPDSFRLLFVQIDDSVSGNLFIADSNAVYESHNFGTTFEKILDFESQITGLYKKPDSDILYVLTTTDLFKVENGQPTSIKQVPVSNEETPEIPTSVSLKQNYPNPFNPTTTIQFELDKATFTKLTVYDVLGRKVQELVNEIRPAGTNTIQFDATNLASGIYLYRLEGNEFVQTKRLTLIK